MPYIQIYVCVCVLDGIHKRSLNSVCACVCVHSRACVCIDSARLHRQVFASSTFNAFAFYFEVSLEIFIEEWKVDTLTSVSHLKAATPERKFVDGGMLAFPRVMKTDEILIITAQALEETLHLGHPFAIAVKLKLART